MKTKHHPMSAEARESLIGQIRGLTAKADSLQETVRYAEGRYGRAEARIAELEGAIKAMHLGAYRDGCTSWVSSGSLDAAFALVGLPRHTGREAGAPPSVSVLAADIRAKCEAEMRPLEEEHAKAVAEARSLLGDRPSEAFISVPALPINEDDQRIVDEAVRKSTPVATKKMPLRTKEPEPCPDEDACDRKAVNNEPRLCSNEACSNEPARNAGGHFERCLGCGEFRGEVDEAEPCSNGYGYQGHASPVVGRDLGSCSDIDALERRHKDEPNGELSRAILVLCEGLRIRRHESWKYQEELARLRTEPAVPSGLERCLQDLAEGGTLVSSKDCSPEEIAFARACERFYVGPNGYGYVLRSRNVALPSSERTETPVVSCSHPEARQQRYDGAISVWCECCGAFRLEGYAQWHTPKGSR